MCVKREKERCVCGCWLGTGTWLLFLSIRIFSGESGRSFASLASLSLSLSLSFALFSCSVRIQVESQRHSLTGLHLSHSRVPYWTCIQHAECVCVLPLQQPATDSHEHLSPVIIIAIIISIIIDSYFNIQFTPLQALHL